MSDRILVVEDERAINRALVELLTRRGYAARGFTSVVDASAEQGFDAAILDVNLPDGSGLSVLRAWRARGLDAPVLLLTAERSGRMIEEAFTTLDAWALFDKPFDGEALCATLADVLARSKVRREMESRAA